jgi:hypothetical protein
MDALRDRQGAPRPPLPLPLEDRHSTALRRVGVATPNVPGRLVDSFLAMPEVFDPALRESPRVRGTLVRAMNILQDEGVHAAIAACLS